MWGHFAVVLLVLCTSSKAVALQEIDDFEEYKYMNLSVDPCEDFYEYTCGNFKNYHPLQDGEAVIDQFSILEDRIIEIANEILSSEEINDDPVSLKKAKAAYQACMDEHFMDNLYMKSPEVQVVKKYGGFPIVDQAGQVPETTFGWNEIADLSAEFGINTFFSVTSYSDLQNTSATLLMITNDKVSLPDQIRPMYPESYDEAIEEGFYKFATNHNKRLASTATENQFEAFLKKLVLKLNRDLGGWKTEDYITEKVSEISTFMNGIYNGGYVPDNVDIDTFPSSITLKYLNEWTAEKFGDLIQIDWVEYVKRLFKYTYADINENTPVLLIGDLSNMLYGILNWVRITDPKIVKSTALIKAFVYMASDSDTETRKDFENYLTESGKTVYPRWQYCSRKIIDITETLSLGLAVAYEYKMKYFNITKLEVITEMINDLKTTFTEIVEEASWMDDVSKEFALKKVNNIITLLAYPKFVSDRELLDQFYENLPICKWDHYENSKVLRAFKTSYMLNMIAKRDRAAWDKSPFITNAYYNRQNNRIIFPIAMLNSVFFSGNASILDYSRIGMVVSHEITHGFDNQGCYYDENGAITVWWTDKTRQNFDINKQCFIDQYAQYVVPEINATMNSSNSLNENIADNGGARNALKALKKKLTRSDYTEGWSNKLKGFTSDQIFFIGFGTMWCNNESIEYLNLLKSTCDTNSSCHPRAKTRVNGVVSNMKEFAEAFSCPSGSSLNPKNKCKLW